MTFLKKNLLEFFKSVFWISAGYWVCWIRRHTANAVHKGDKLAVVICLTELTIFVALSMLCPDFSEWVSSGQYPYQQCRISRRKLRKSKIQLSLSIHFDTILAYDGQTWCHMSCVVIRGGACCRIWNAIVSHRRRSTATSTSTASASAANATDSAPATSSWIFTHDCEYSRRDCYLWPVSSVFLVPHPPPHCCSVIVAEF